MTPEWMLDGACRGIDPNLFNHERGDNAAIRQAKAVCAGCPVRSDCLYYALSLGVRLLPGVWGGTSERERRKMRAPILPQTCPHCCETFTPYRRGLKYCKPECREAARIKQQLAWAASHAPRDPYPRMTGYEDRLGPSRRSA